MNKIYFYAHGGSANHGCEAIVRGSLNILSNKNIKKKLFCFNKSSDIQYGLDKIIELEQLGPQILFKKTWKSELKKVFPKSLFDFIKNRLKKGIRQNYCLTYNNLFDKEQIALYLSIGGDMYCYDNNDMLGQINKNLNSQNKKTILWGCSIEPHNIKENKILIEDLKRYSLITARESLTYKALIDNGINKNTHLFPDPAFLLDKEVPTNLPNNFIPHNTVGLNLSPMVQNLEQGSNIAYKNFVELMKYIINNTNMNIALVPHVVYENTNDLEPLTKLYKQFRNTNRVCLINKPYNACQLKGIISQCRFMIAARTHASIAAYSTQVPTLVIGYSVKAKGIAKDIFGDYKDYVLPVQELKEKTEVVEAFKNLMQNENKIREHYKSFMSSYIERTWLAGKEVEKLFVK